MTSSQTPRSRAHHFGPTRNADHFLYRCYDAEDVLLYIGCTANVKRRLAAHSRGDASNKVSRWLSASMVRHDIEGPFRGRDAGRNAEREAIHREQPLFNYQERAGVDLAAWMTRRPIALYLVEHGHIGLALETACTCARQFREMGAYHRTCAAHAAAQVAGITNLRSTEDFTDADWTRAAS